VEEPEELEEPEDGGRTGRRWKNRTKVEELKNRKIVEDGGRDHSFIADRFCRNLDA
jgi:hypothetical protein